MFVIITVFLLQYPFMNLKTYREVSTNPIWQQAMTEELQDLSKTHTWIWLTPTWEIYCLL